MTQKPKIKMINMRENNMNTSIKIIVVNRTHHSLDGGSLKIMSTVPFTDLFQDVFYERVEVRYQI